MIFFLSEEDDIHKLTIVASPRNDDQLSNHSDHSCHSSDHSSDEGAVY